MKELSTQLRAAIVADFLYQYNKRWDEDWCVDIRAEYDRIDVFRKRNLISCDGHFLGALTDFCREKFNTNPCVGYYSEGLVFYF